MNIYDSYNGNMISFVCYYQYKVIARTLSAVLAVTWLAVQWSAILCRGMAYCVMAGPGLTWCDLAYRAVAWLCCATSRRAVLCFGLPCCGVPLQFNYHNQVSKYRKSRKVLIPTLDAKSHISHTQSHSQKKDVTLRP